MSNPAPWPEEALAILREERGAGTTSAEIAVRLERELGFVRTPNTISYHARRILRLERQRRGGEPWPGTAIEILRLDWLAGHSAGQIARRLKVELGFARALSTVTRMAMVEGLPRHPKGGAPLGRVTPASQQRQTQPGERLRSGEIEPGRVVHNNWDKALFEPFSAFKARRAAERVAQRQEARA